MSDDLRSSLAKTPSNAALTLEEKIQRKLDRETGGRRKGSRGDRSLVFSMPPQAAGADASAADPDREALRRALLDKRKKMPVTKHLSASMKMQMNAEELAKLGVDEEDLPKGWECEKCTFVNENMDHLACSVCSAPRYKK